MKTILVALILGVLVSAYSALAEDEPTSGQAGHTAHQGMMLTGDMQKDMKMMNEMMVTHLGESDPQYDARLIDMLIPHHEGALAMATDALKKTTHPEIKAIVTKMIKDQKKEIEDLKKLRAAWYGEAAETK